MMTVGDDLHELRTLATRLAQARQAEILIYSGELTRPGDGDLSLGRNDRPRPPNCLLILRTLGGSADAAYRLVRTLGRQYRRLIVYIDDSCKGAGMLLALAADELVISDFGELGPLDLVSQHAIMPGHGESGLAPLQGLQALRAEAQTTFENYLSRFRSRRSLGMTSRSSLEHASALAIGLMGPVFSHIDPLQVAEVDRAMKTATLYAQRLGGNHLKEGALDRLLTGYPSHDFVIDREEAHDLFRTVRAPTAEESAFLTQVEPMMCERRFQGHVLAFDDAFRLLSSRGSERPAGAPAERPVASSAEGSSETGEPEVTSGQPTS
jgi:hypothetical protein